MNNWVTSNKQKCVQKKNKKKNKKTPIKPINTRYPISYSPTKKDNDDNVKNFGHIKIEKCEYIEKQTLFFLQIRKLIHYT